MSKQIEYNVLSSIQLSSNQKQKFHIFLQDRKVEVIWRCYNHVFKHYQRQRNKTQDTCKTFVSTAYGLVFVLEARRKKLENIYT